MTVRGNQCQSKGLDYRVRAAQQRNNPWRKHSACVQRLIVDSPQLWLHLCGRADCARRLSGDQWQGKVEVAALRVGCCRPLVPDPRRKTWRACMLPQAAHCASGDMAAQLRWQGPFVSMPARRMGMLCKRTALPSAHPLSLSC